MANHWQQVPIEQARQHALYGVGGWLVFFAVGLLLSLFRELGAANVEAYKAGMTFGELLTIDHPAALYLKAALGLQAAMIVIIYWLLFSKHPSFRKTTSALLLAGWPVVALLGVIQPFPGLVNALAVGFFSWALSCGVWVTYLQRSRRVRITFEHCVATDGQGNAHCVVPSERPSVVTPLAHGTREPQPAPAWSAPPEVAHADQSTRPVGAVEEEFWSNALAEFEGPSQRPGVWARAYAEAQGNEAVAKAAYLRYRASELERQAKERAREAELERLAGEQRAYELIPKGRCPNSNCRYVMPLSQKTCVKCGALFDDGGWNLIPIEET